MNSAIHRIGLRFDLRRRRRQFPRPDIRIDCRGEQIGKHADGRRAEVM